MTSVLLAASAEGASRVLAVFVGIAVVGAAATFATTRLYARLQRHRWIAALTAGGWFATVAGILIGTRVLAAVDAGALFALRPLVGIALAWIGLIVGLQLRRTLVRAIPPELGRWLTIDTLTGAVVGGGVAAWWWWSNHATLPVTALAPAALTLVLAFIGWAPETRTLRAGLSPHTVAPAQFVQAGGGLGAVIAVAAFGLATPVLQGLGGDDGGAGRIGIAALEITLAAASAVLLGTGARLLLHHTAGRKSEALVITLSLVFLCSGIANELGFSPLVSGMLAGLVIANLRDPHLRDLERGLQSAEPGMAVLMLLSCGSLAAAADLGQAIPLGVAIAALRLAVKPFVARRTLLRTFPNLDRDEPLLLGPARLPMIAIAIAVGPVLASDGGPTATVLASVMIALLLGAIAPAIAARRRAGADVGGSEAVA